MLNCAIIMGRLTADPELKTTQSGIGVTSFSVAVDRNYTPKGQEKQTDFINVVAWRQTAEFVTRYFHKGSMIAIEGSIQTRKYQDKNGNNRTAVEIVANNVSFCGSKAESGTTSGDGGYGYQPAAQQTASYQTAGAADFEELPDDEDDLPF